MILISPSTAIAAKSAMEKWFNVKIHFAKESGFIQYALNKRTFQKNGSALIAEDNERRQSTPYLEAISQTKTRLIHEEPT